MQQVDVALRASTPVGRAGLAAHLRPYARFRILSEDAETEADVAVVCCDRFGPDIMAWLRRAAFAGRASVVLLVNEISEPELLAAVDYRVVAVIPRRTVTAARLAEAVEAATVRPRMPDWLVSELLRHIENLHQEVPLDLGAGQLSAREVDILRLMADGLDTREIAAKLSYSERTVKHVIYGLTRQLRVRNRSHAVAWALRNGVI